VVGAAGKSVGPHTHITCLGPPLFLRRPAARAPHGRPGPQDGAPVPSRWPCQAGRQRCPVPAIRSSGAESPPEVRRRGSCGQVAAYGPVSAFTPMYLPRLGIAERDVPFWVGAITSFSSFFGLPFLPLWGALADRYGRKPIIIRSSVVAAVALAIAATAPNVW